MNRHRCRALRKLGHVGHCLYYSPGSGMQNISDIPTFIANNDAELIQIIEHGRYDAIIATTDYGAFPRFRSLGYTGKFILEIQGYGPQTVARNELTKGIACITQYASALLNPKTFHIAALFDELFPSIPKFHFNNPFDSEMFTYRDLPKITHPIIAWVGRIEDNKNWREFLTIGSHLIHYYNPYIRLWMFEDPDLANAQEREQFKREIERLKLEPYLTIYHNVPNDQMQTYFSMIGDSGGFLCLTSKEEGGPYCVLEAMSCRCPVVSSRKDGVASTIIHNETGKLYTLGDIVEALQESISLLSNEQLRESIRTEAQRLVCTEFTLERYAQNFINMIESI